MKRSIFSDPSLWLLIASNLVVIFFAIKDGWNISTMVWIYWFQSIIIGFFNFIRILKLKEFSTQGFTLSGFHVKETPGTKIFTAFYFAFHYGFFHFIYLGFLLSGAFVSLPPLMEFRYILLTTALFFLNHLFSYFYNRSRDTKKQNIGTIMFYPYARIIPMHLTIIFGSFLGGSLLLFLSLKTLADGVMHFVEHNNFRGDTIKQ